MHEIFLQRYCMKWVLGDPQKKILFDINQTSILFNKENTKVERSVFENLHVSSGRSIILQRQLGVGCLSTQALYFWHPVLLKICPKAQILRFPPFS